MSDYDGLFLLKVRIVGKEPMQKVLVVIDGDKGVTIDQCAGLGRKIGAELEEIELFSSAYHLEVSSAGVDTPLESRRQYVKNIGRNVKITLTDGNEIEGQLLEVLEETIELQLKKQKKEKEAQKMSVPFNEIKKTFVTISFK